MVQSELARQEPWGLAEMHDKLVLDCLHHPVSDPKLGEMADVDEVGMSLGAEISPRVGLEGTGSKGREAENCLVE